MSDEAVLAVVDALERTNTPYMLVGSLSCNVYTFPRSTQDADFVIDLDARGAAALLNELRGAFRIDPQMSFETVTATQRFCAESLQTGFKIELFLLRPDPHDRERFARRRLLPVLGRQAYIPTAEDVVITKLRWSAIGKRSKDRDDARNVIASQRDRLDWPYIELWCDQHGTRALLDELRRSIPPA